MQVPARFRSNRRGAVAVVFASSVVTLLCVAGFAIDLGNINAAHRTLQGATDLAAISAASDLPNALTAAHATASANAYSPDEVTRLELGTYIANPAVPVVQRFQPAVIETANAVRVTMTHQQPLFFANIFNMEAGTGTHVGNTFQIVTTGIATAQRTVSFEIGSGVASFNGGVANAVLGAAIGGNVSLSALDYNALASANVGMFDFAYDLAVQLGKVGAPYGQLFSGPVLLSNVIAALQSAAPALATTLAPLQSAAAASGVTVDRSKLADFGPYSHQAVDGQSPPTTATVTAFNLLQAALQLGGSSHVIALNIAADIPGITTVTGTMTLGEPPQGTTLIAVDTVGASVHTAQVRLMLNVGLAGNVGGGAVNLPLYVEAGYGTAVFEGLACSTLTPSATAVTLNVTPGLLNGAIGAISPAAMTDYSTEPVATPAVLLNLAPVITVTGLAQAAIENLSATAERFDATQIQNASVEVTSTEDFASSLITTLIGKLVLQGHVLGATVPVSTPLSAGIAGVLAASVTPVDQLVSGVLQTLGLGVGEASTWVTGANCAPAVLRG